jgi:peptide/nickel transport system permease protein
VIAIVFGILFGIISKQRDTWIDRLIALVQALGMSIPSFFSAILFAWLFGFVLHKYTNLNMTGSLYEVDDLMKEVIFQWKISFYPAVF